MGDGLAHNVGSNPLSRIRMAPIAFAVTALFACLQITAASIALFHLLDWTWSSSDRWAGAATFCVLFISSIFEWLSAHPRSARSGRLLSRISLMASGFFVGGALSAYASPAPGVSGIIGGVIGAAMWLSIQFFPSRGADQPAIWTSRLAATAATISSACLAFWFGAMAINAFQGGAPGAAMALGAGYGLAAFLAWRQAERGFRLRRSSI